MFISNGIVYGGQPKDVISVLSVKPLDDMIMLITFSNGETRLFDATVLNGVVFEPLKNEEIFKAAKVEFGVVTWMDGDIDCAPEFMYSNSYEYSMVS